MTPQDLKHWRTDLKLSQRAAAEALGMSLRGYQKLEWGESPIDRRTALACAAIKHRLPAA
jgi:transcriptional regulator with XRE-family HTH domain